MNELENLTYYEKAGSTLDTGENLVTRLKVTKLPMPIYHALRKLYKALSAIAKIPKDIINKSEIDLVDYDKSLIDQQEYLNEVVNQWEIWSSLKK